MAIRDIYLCIGGNLGDRDANMEEVLTFIEFNFGDVIAVSPIVESEGWKMTNVPPFLNQIVHIRSTLTNAELIEEIHDLDDFYGREKSEGQYLSRTMDLDILLIGDEIIAEEELNVPHRYMHERRFVLDPFARLYPEVIHPVYGKTIAELLNECPDTNPVALYRP
jgi:2-amino-4-hydroxy-6-hydroxymethyldihydropteridine diphosphokinase